MNPVSKARDIFEGIIARITGVFGQSTEGMREILYFGCMTSSAIVSPILFEFRGVWALDIIVFVLTAGGFVFKHLKNIKKYSLFLVPPAGILCLTTYLKRRGTFIPILLCLAILLAAYTLPRVFPGVAESDTEYQLALEEGLLPRFNGTVAEPGSVQDFEDHYSHREPIMMARFREQDISHMDRSPSRLSRILSAHESDIELNGHNRSIGAALWRMVESFSQLPGTTAVEEDPMLSEPGLPLDYESQTSSLEVAHHPDSTSAESAPLLRE